MRKMKEFLEEEDGFLVFEQSMLSHGAVVIAIFIAGVVLAIVALHYTNAENAFIGNGSEADEALSQFYP